MLTQVVNPPRRPARPARELDTPGPDGGSDARRARAAVTVASHCAVPSPGWPATTAIHFRAQDAVAPALDGLRCDWCYAQCTD